jgi:lysozyme family protein
MKTEEFETLCQRRLDAIKAEFDRVMEDADLKDRKKLKRASKLLKEEMKIQALKNKVTRLSQQKPLQQS